MIECLCSWIPHTQAGTRPPTPPDCRAIMGPSYSLSSTESILTPSRGAVLPPWYALKVVSKPWTSDLVVSEVAVALNWPGLPWTCEVCGRQSEDIRDWKQVSGGPYPADYRGRFCPKCELPEVCGDPSRTHTPSLASSFRHRVLARNDREPSCG